MLGCDTSSLDRPCECLIYTQYTVDTYEDEHMGSSI